MSYVLNEQKIHVRMKTKAGFPGFLYYIHNVQYYTNNLCAKETIKVNLINPLLFSMMKRALGQDKNLIH